MEIYVKYGGVPFWSEFISRFYSKVIRDGLLREVFVHGCCFKFKEMQLNIIESTLSGAIFDPQLVMEAHQHLSLCEAKVNQYLRLYAETLSELGVEQEDADFILSRLDEYREPLTQYY